MFGAPLTVETSHNEWEKKVCLPKRPPLSLWMVNLAKLKSRLQSQKHHLQHKRLRWQYIAAPMWSVHTFFKLQLEPSTISTPTTWIDESNPLKPSHISFLSSLALRLVFTVQGLRDAICLGHPRTAANFKLFLITHCLLAYWYSNKSLGWTFKAPLNDALANEKMGIHFWILQLNMAVRKSHIRTLDVSLQFVQ